MLYSDNYQVSDKLTAPIFRVKCLGPKYGDRKHLLNFEAYLQIDTST